VFPMFADSARPDLIYASLLSGVRLAGFGGVSVVYVSLYTDSSRQSQQFYQLSEGCPYHFCPKELLRCAQHDILAVSNPFTGQGGTCTGAHAEG
jgi:hypothetical protein